MSTTATTTTTSAPAAAAATPSSSSSSSSSSTTRTSSSTSATPEYKHIKVKPLHPTFGAEVSGIDFSRPVSDEVFADVLAAITKYGVLVFRNAGLDDERHIAFSRRFGELDDVAPYLAGGRPHRLDHVELFDVGNIDLDGSVFPVGNVRSNWNKANGIFHVDSSFNPRRAGYSLLRAHELPPKGTGGHTLYADTRTAWDELEPNLKARLVENDYIAAHSLWHSRRRAAPDFFAHIVPEDHPFSRHRLVQRHEPSGRTNLYIASHIHHIEGLPEAESRDLFEKLYAHAQQPKYVLEVQWENAGDLVAWDNTCVMHRAGSGTFEGKYPRDMRRTTVHDGSSMAWGLNEKSDVRQGLP